MKLALTRVADAVQRVALAERCTADPGTATMTEFDTIPVLQRTTSLRFVLRCARDTRYP
jgi:hypothetical protein